jgi:translation initiation factor IF-1
VVKQSGVRYEGKVVEALPNATFQIELENGSRVKAQVSGRMRMNRIRVVPGDRVIVELTTYDPEKGRIVFRLA